MKIFLPYNVVRCTFLSASLMLVEGPNWVVSICLVRLIKFINISFYRHEKGKNITSFEREVYRRSFKFVATYPS